MCAAALLCACGPNMAKVRQTVSGFTKKRIAVLPFKDNQADPNSGEAAQARLCQSLTQAGFTVVNRADLDQILNEQKVQLSGVVDPAQAVELGKLSGADIVLTGSVGDAAVVPVTNPPVYTTQYTTYYTPDGMPVQRPVQVLVTPGSTYYEARYSVAVKFTDLTTGNLLWSDVESSTVADGTIDAAARNTADRIAARLFKEIEKDGNL